MRKFINLVENLEEHTVVSELGLGDVKQFVAQATEIGKLNDSHVVQLIDHEQQFFALINKDDILAHMIVEERSSSWWAMELRSYRKGQGYGSQLLEWVVKNVHAPLYNDIELTPDSIHSLEKMVARGSVKASLADLKSGLRRPYTKDDQHTGLYDMDIIGIPRPAISKEEAKNIVWVFEQHDRKGMLSQYIKFGPTSRM